MPPGIYETPTGFRVIACIGRGKGKRAEKSFPKGTSTRVMTRWQEDTRQELRTTPGPAEGSLGADIEAYMAVRLTMPTATERRKHLELWARELGQARHRDTITPLEIRAILEKWHAAGKAPSTCNGRRTALQSFFTVLNGRGGKNPVRDVPKYDARVLPPRRIDYPTFEAILAAMPDRSQSHAGEPRGTISQTKARLRVLAYTGLPHAQITRIEPAHLNAQERLLFVPGRKKGGGTNARWLPLGTHGVEAVQGLIAAKALGPFSRSSLHTSFTRAARKVGRRDLRPYDLRHLFGQTLLRVSKNRSATRDLMLHLTDRTTAWYTANEIPGELRAALALFDADVVARGCGTTPEPGDSAAVKH